MSSRRPVLIERPCDACGRLYEAHTARSRWCSERCRGRARRGGTSAASQPEPSTSTALHDAVLTDLTAAGRENTAAGRIALDLAASIDARTDPLSSRAAAARELRACLAAALSGLPPHSDVLDELAARRRRRQQGNQGPA